MIREPMNAPPSPASDAVDGHRVDAVIDQVETAAQQGLQSVRHLSRQWLDKTDRVSERGLDYVRREPVKAVLVAAAAGALLTVLLGLLARSSRSS